MTFRLRFAVLSMALGALLPLASAPAAAATATLSGVARDGSKNPVAGVTVTATNTATKAAQSATTDAEGRYSLSLDPGTYSVKYSGTGFRLETASIDVTAAGPNTLDLALHPMLSEAVTVTALKRETAPIDVPSSLAVRTEDELRDVGANGIEDVAATVGGFTVQNLGPGQSQVAMRGVSSGQIARDQPGVKEQVGIYLDESPVSLSLFTPDLDLVDVNRVEVLRGPQGTLFGSGSVTGTVRYVTNQPVMGSTEGFAEAGAGIADGGSGAGDVKAGVNVPLGTNSAMRFVGYYTHLPGFTDDIHPKLTEHDDVNDGYRAGGRVAFAFTPNGALTITPRLLYQRLETNGWNREDIYNILANPFTTTRPQVDFDDRQQFTQYPESTKDDFALADVKIVYDFGSMDLTSITSYMYRDLDIVRDTTALTASFTGGTAGFPEPIYTLDSPLFDMTTAKTWTEELRLAGSTTRWHWLVGGFYSHARRDYGQNVSVPGFEDATGIPTEGRLAPKDSIFFSDLGYDLDQFGLFGEATLAMTSRSSLTGGLRYYNFNEDKTQLIDGAFGNPNNGGKPLSQPGSTDADGFAPRLIWSYKISDDLVFNAQASKGFRLGGINDPINVPLCTPQDLVTFGNQDKWKDETVWNYEVGLKSRLMGGRASFDAAAFYIDISDLQTTVTAGTCTSRLIFNVPRARSQGIELDFQAAPTRNFDVGFSGSWNDSELRSTLTSTDAGGNVTVVSGIEKGRRLPSVPEVQASVSATWQFPLSGGTALYLTGTDQYIGSRFTQVGDEDLGTLDLTFFGPNTIGGPLTKNKFTYDPKLPSYNLINLRFGWRVNTWDLSAYVNNVTDELALLSFDRERGTLARIGYITNQPRTFGLSARYLF